MATKKVKHAGRFRTGYGIKARAKLILVATKQRKKQICPLCNGTLKRKTKGIWECKKCKKKIAAGTYTFN